MLIREMTLEDISQIVEIEQASFSMPWSQKSFEDSIPREDTIFLVSEEENADIIRAYQKNADEKEVNEKLFDENTAEIQVPSETCLCNKKNMITGYIGMYISFEEASITNVAVHPSYRKFGYGKELVSAAITKAKNMQVEKIFLEVRVSNEPAISLYQKMGFENLGIRKNFYDHPQEDAYIMSCNISSC